LAALSLAVSGFACEGSLETGARDAAVNGAVTPGRDGASTPVEDAASTPVQDAASTPVQDGGGCGVQDAGDAWNYLSAEQVASFGWNDAGTVTLVSPAWVAVQCARTTCSPRKAASVGDTQKLLVRRWARCSPLGPFHTPEDGMQINGDGTYVFLAWSAGALVAEVGDTYVGRVEYLDTSAFNGRPAIQVDLDAGPGDAGLGGIDSFPDFYQDPPIMSYNDNGVETYRFVALP
jgi:hypothetical protein